MFTLEEMGTEVKGAAATIRGFQELLRGIDTEESLDEPTDEELCVTVWRLFAKTVKEMLRYKTFVLWSEPDDVTVHILETSEKCEMWIKDAERLFTENPIPDSNDPKMDEFEQRNRFVREISFEQFANSLEMNLAILTITALVNADLSLFSRIAPPVVEARAAGKL